MHQNQGADREKNHKKGFAMTEKLNPNKIDDSEQLLISNTIQLDSVVQLLIEKGIFSKKEYSEMVDKVLKEYQKGE
jgi:hypothetical protein